MRVYSTWQVLLAAEVADMGVHFRINLADEEIRRTVFEANDGGRRPGDWAVFVLSPIIVTHGFIQHRSALEAVIWFVEESHRALLEIAKHEPARFILNADQNTEFAKARCTLADRSALRHKITQSALVEVCGFLSDRWAVWNRDGRPFITDAYKDFLSQAIVMAQLLYDLSFEAMRNAIGKRSGYFKPILDAIWPDWTEEEKARLSRTLAVRSFTIGSDLEEDDIKAFAKFIESNNLESVFWRLHSFEEHALRGNDFAMEAMRSDLQGMAVAMEHVARALGGTKGQLYDMFKELWRDPQVVALLKRDDITSYARQARLATDWPALKGNIENLRNRSRAGMVVADLVMTHRIRGGVHTLLPEDDHFELERLFVSVVRAGALTFAEVRRRTLPVQSATQLSPP